MQRPRASEHSPLHQSIDYVRRDGRLAGPSLRLRSQLRSDPSVLLIDDVTTTGATLTAAARLLQSGGALAVHGSVVTRARRRSSGAT